MKEWSLKRKIKELLNKDSHIICGFDYDYLFNNEASSVGHVALILDISEDNDYIKIYDPGPKKAGIKKVEVEELFEAIYSIKDGIWEINYNSLFT